ncbi:hypothetical protein CANCADRAFT_140802 [Tortispora caseinolytica NRRL Y-17796]|uniref:GYF domain-containing protein n=1 Tax=Tortispora caseinolytica NRRL Y-17796 TaxID=767744 RepID=A0A1E4TCR3_9ASCO|nr:hypothetical protein CANCADRAFT_140802 [Tortispora caseinolytica NRRL Y-17796]
MRPATDQQTAESASDSSISRQPRRFFDSSANEQNRNYDRHEPSSEWHWQPARSRKHHQQELEAEGSWKSHLPPANAASQLPGVGSLPDLASLNLDQVELPVNSDNRVYTKSQMVALYQALVKSGSMSQISEATREKIATTGFYDFAIAAKSKEKEESEAAHSKSHHRHRDVGQSARRASHTHDRRPNIDSYSSTSSRVASGIQQRPLPDSHITDPSSFIPNLPLDDDIGSSQAQAAQPARQSLFSHHAPAPTVSPWATHPAPSSYHSPLGTGTSQPLSNVHAPLPGFDTRHPQKQSPVQPQLLNAHEISWVYKDQTGQERGPFLGTQMQEWYSGKWLEPQLLLRRLEDREFIPLSQWVMRLGDAVNPFLVPQPRHSPQERHRDVSGSFIHDQSGYAAYANEQLSSRQSPFPGQPPHSRSSIFHDMINGSPGSPAKQELSSLANNAAVLHDNSQERYEPAPVPQSPWGVENRRIVETKPETYQPLEVESRAAEEIPLKQKKELEKRNISASITVPEGSNSHAEPVVATSSTPALGSTESHSPVSTPATQGKAAAPAPSSSTSVAPVPVSAASPSVPAPWAASYSAMAVKPLPIDAQTKEKSEPARQSRSRTSTPVKSKNSSKAAYKSIEIVAPQSKPDSHNKSPQSPWGQPVKSETTVKSIEELVKEENKARKAVSGSNKPSTKPASAAELATAAMIGEPSSTNSNEWTTVVKSKKPTANKSQQAGVVGAPSNQQLRPIKATSYAPKAGSVNTHAVSSSAVPAAVKRKPSGAELFLIWAREELSGLNKSVNSDSLLSMFLTLPAGRNSDSLEIIADSIYSNSASIDGRRFAEEFCKRRQEVESTVLAELGTNGWNVLLSRASNGLSLDDFSSDFTVVPSRRNKRHN